MSSKYAGSQLPATLAEYPATQRLDWKAHRLYCQQTAAVTNRIESNAVAAEKMALVSGALNDFTRGKLCIEVLALPLERGLRTRTSRAQEVKDSCPRAYVWYALSWASYFPYGR